MLFLKDSKEVRLFGSLSQLESHIEAIDVINGEYEAFSSDGRRINLVAENALSAPRGEPAEIDPSRARRLILDYHSKLDERFSEVKSLEDLISDLVWFYGYGSSEAAN